MGGIVTKCEGCGQEFRSGEQVVKMRGMRYHVRCYESYSNGVKDRKDTEITTALRNVIRAWERYEDPLMIEPYITKGRELIWPTRT